MVPADVDGPVVGGGEVVVDGYPIFVFEAADWEASASIDEDGLPTWVAGWVGGWGVAGYGWVEQVRV